MIKKISTDKKYKEHKAIKECLLVCNLKEKKNKHLSEGVVSNIRATTSEINEIVTGTEKELKKYIKENNLTRSQE